MNLKSFNFQLVGLFLFCCNLFVFFLISLPIFGQEDSIIFDSFTLNDNSRPNSFESMNMYSPNTYSLGRYGDVPVDYSRGKTEVSIPLTVINSANLSVDVSLSYYGGGIKVDQEAGTVGLGWNLIAGGVITRQVRGIPDGFDINGNFLSRPSIRMVQNVGESNKDFFKSEFSKIQYVANVYDSGKGQEDPSPDLFYFNFCGSSGSFYLDSNAHGIATRNNEYKIDMLISKKNNAKGWEYFKIYDDKGIEYIFDRVEESIQNGESVISAWYLSTIKSPIGDSIMFHYEEGGVLSKASLERQSTTFSMPVNPNAPNHVIPNQYKNQILQDGPIIKGLVLSKISSSTGDWILFEYDRNHRKDGQAGMGDMLTAIKSYNIWGNIVKQYILKYDYFLSDYRNQQPNGKSYDFLNYRLKLCSIQELSLDGKEDIPAYKFDYYGDDGDVTYMLPYRMSPSQDGWGYNNGAYFNTNIFTGNSKDEEFRVNHWYSLLESDHESAYFESCQLDGGADRSFNNEAIKAAMLKKIVYPLGGSTSFVYGSHSVNNTYGKLGYGGLRIEKIVNEDGVGNKIERQFSYGYPTEPTTCGLWENYYHTAFHQKVQDGIGVNRELFLAFGISPWLIDKPDVLLVTSAPLPAYGVESEFCYSHVTEIINEKKRVEYEYMCQSNTYDAAEGANAPYYDMSLLLYDSTNGLIGKQIYSYSGSSCELSSVHLPNREWGRGNLLYKKVYDDNGILYSEDKYDYNIGTLTANVGYVATAVTADIYIISSEYVFSGYSQLKRETHIKDKVKMEIEYQYPNHNRVHPSIKIMAKSDGKMEKEFYYYPQDYDNIFRTLDLKNIVQPVDVRKYTDEKLVSGIQVNFNEYGQVVDLYKFDGEDGDIPFSSTLPFTFTSYIQKKYNSDTHLLESEYNVKEDKLYSYIWSYNNTYPIARIAQCGKATDNILLFQLRKMFKEKINPNNADFSYLSEKLSTIPHTLSILYKYIPSIGLAETIDSRNVHYLYEYDNFGRLSAKKMKIGDDSYLLEDYKINFKK